MGLVRIICFVYRNFQAILLSIRIYFLGALFICHSGSPSCTINVFPFNKQDARQHLQSDYLHFHHVQLRPLAVPFPAFAFCLGLFVVCFALDLFAALSLLSFDYDLHYLHPTLRTTTIIRRAAAAASAVSRRFRICLPYKYCRINMPACSLSLAYDMHF